MTFIVSDTQNRYIFGSSTGRKGITCSTGRTIPCLAAEPARAVRDGRHLEHLLAHSRLQIFLAPLCFDRALANVRQCRLAGCAV